MNYKENDAVFQGEKDRQCPGSGQRASGGAYSSDDNSYRCCPVCGVQLPVLRGEKVWPHNVPRILAMRPKAKT